MLVGLWHLPACLARYRSELHERYARDIDHGVPNVEFCPRWTGPLGRRRRSERVQRTLLHRALRSKRAARYNLRGPRIPFAATFSATSDYAGAVAIDGQQRILVAGFTPNTSFVARLSPDGALDPTFAAQAATPGVWLDPQDRAGAVPDAGFLIPDRDGVYVAGYEYLLRLLDDGTPDSGFPVVTDLVDPVAGVALSDGVVVADYASQGRW